MSAPAGDRPLFPFGPILFFGDSVTASWTAQMPQAFSGPQTVARGIPGQTTRDMARRLRSEIALYGARGLHLICGRDDILGGNPGVTRDGIVADIRAMLSDTRDLYVRSWVGSIPRSTRPHRPLRGGPSGSSPRSMPGCATTSTNTAPPSSTTTPSWRPSRAR